MSKRNNEHLKLSDALKVFISENKLESGINDQKVKDLWPQLMGNGISNYTVSVELKQQTLYIKLSSSVLKEELSYGKSKIISMLNESLEENLITKLVFL